MSTTTTEQRAVLVSDLIGRLEAAEIVGVHATQINRLLRRRSDFPRPLAHLSGALIFSRAEVEAWAKAYRA